jgi:hypothetical protein
VRRQWTLLLALALALGACSSVSTPAPAPTGAPATVAPPALALPAETAAPAEATADRLRCTERVALPAIADVVEARWAPDSSALAVVRFRRAPTRWFLTGYEEQRILTIVDMATGATRDVQIATHPEWSEKGGYLSFWRDEYQSKDDEYLWIVRDGKTAALVPSTQPDGRWVGDELLHWYDSEIRAWKDGKTRTVAKVDVPSPLFPADDAQFSADGERFTLTRYTLRGEVTRYVGTTRTGALTQLPGPVAYTEWSTHGATLLLRTNDQVTLRSADGAQRTLTVPSGTVHGWTADGRLLLGTMSPTLPGGDALDQFTVVGTEGAVATLPNVMGARSFSPDGKYFAGVSRTGVGSTQLELFRCATAPTATDLRADPQARARQERLEGQPQRLVRPVAGAITNFVENRHNGVDVAAPLGSVVYASDDGVVTATEWVPVGGYRVCITRASSLEICAYHSALSLVKVGETVVRGQPIALVGMTGITTGPHTHWEVKLDGKVVDPLAY